jgi:predicted MPP superfamily phosphohydrolase
VVPKRERLSGIAPFIVIVQAILFLGHALVYETWVYFWGKPRLPHLPAIFILLSISFVPASMVVWRYANVFAWLFYRAAAVWLGGLSFFFWASVACWAIYGGSQLAGLHVTHRGLLLAVFGAAALASVAAILNAARVRTTRISVKLPGLPEAWKGRTAVLAGDLHLGPVRGYRFARYVVKLARELKPEIVLITGDFYDGTAVDAVKMASTWKDFPAPLGVYYVTGNHEEFSDRTEYLNAARSAGMRILNNEKVTIDGLQIAGALYGEASDPEVLREVLRTMNLNRERASILLSHVPQHLNIAEEAGVSLQLSGHTHKGQVIPWSWLAARVHGKFVYGLNRFRQMLVYTTSGAGTWGPPMRLGTRSEIVLIRFE